VDWSASRSAIQGLIDVNLAAQIMDRLGLKHAVVVDTPEDHLDLLRRQLGQVAAELLAEVIDPEDVLGIAWSRGVGAMAKALPRLSSVSVVQLTGAISMPDDDHSSIDIVRDVARAASGPAYVFYAPFIVPDAATAHALRHQRDVARAFGQLPRVTKAVVGLGLWSPGQSTIYDTAPERDRRTLTRLGVCAEVSGVFLSADGKPVHTDLTERMIGINAEQMRAIPEVTTIAYGAAKVAAAHAALRSGLITGLVTHKTFAQSLK
jgi:DNA-binding transcriptional regulator LsrR (DeoR family)